MTFFYFNRNKKTSEQSELCSDVVRLKGFEPPTYWFVASHSIQLSYSRIPKRGVPLNSLLSIAPLAEKSKRYFQFF